MVKKTKSNFNSAVCILMNQCYMNYYQACEKARLIFAQVQNDRNNGIKTTVEHYLLYEIKSIE